MSTRWAVLPLFLVMLLGCGGGQTKTATVSATPDQSAKPKRTIGLSVLTLTNPFFKEIADSLKLKRKRTVTTLSSSAANLTSRNSKTRLRILSFGKFLRSCSARAIPDPSAR